MIRSILLKTGHIANLDDFDYESIRKHEWRYSNGYARTFFEGKEWGMHEMILGQSSLDIHHKDGNGLNNVRSNLVRCTHAQNIAAARMFKHNTSGYRGVSAAHHKNGKQMYVAYIKVNGKKINLGSFDNPKVAALAYNEAAVKHFGEFAFQNKIN